MPANIRYIVQDSNRMRVGQVPGTELILSAILRTSDLSFMTDGKTKFSYDGTPETITLAEDDNQKITISYLTETAILQVREWYKSVSDGSQFEIDLDGSGNYQFCVLKTKQYAEQRIGDTLEYSVAFEVRWT